MKTEIQLQGQVIGTLYLIAAITMAILGVQNYRYGIYPLVYTASLVALIFFGVAIYARFAYKVSTLERVSLATLSAATLIILLESPEHSQSLTYWLIPLGLFSFIALPLKQAYVLNTIVVTIFSVVLYQHTSFLGACLFATSYSLMIAFAGTFAALHQKRSRTLVELAIHEPLTGAYNIRFFEDTLSKEISRATRTGKPLSLITIEIDYFDQVEEMHGVAVKNQLLQQVSETLQGMIRAGDSQYFDAQERYYLLLPCTPAEGVLVIAERIRRTVEENTWPDVDSITASLGCTSYIPSKGEISAQDMLNKSEQALKDAHKNGYNRVAHQN